jgi:hypothetical protein
MGGYHRYSPDAQLHVQGDSNRRQSDVNATRLPSESTLTGAATTASVDLATTRMDLDRRLPKSTTSSCRRRRPEGILTVTGSDDRFWNTRTLIDLGASTNQWKTFYTKDAAKNAERDGREYSDRGSDDPVDPRDHPGERSGIGHQRVQQALCRRRRPMA